MSADIERRARLSYDQVKRSSGFKSHIMISDYLGIAEESSAQDDRISINEENISDNSTAIAANAQGVSNNAASIAQINDMVSGLEAVYSITEVSESYTTAGSCTLVFTNTSHIDVQLNESPTEYEIVHFSNAGSSTVKFIGEINGSQNMTVLYSGSGGTIFYSQISGWRLR